MLTDNVFIVHLVRVDITPLFLSLYAIDTGALKDLDLAIVHEKELADCTGVINGMLSLSNYDIGMLSSWKIYGAPGSHLAVLELCTCCLGSLKCYTVLSWNGSAGMAGSVQMLPCHLVLSHPLPNCASYA